MVGATPKRGLTLDVGGRRAALTDVKALIVCSLRSRSSDVSLRRRVTDHHGEPDVPTVSFYTEQADQPEKWLLDRG
jgi:hypothetical protein